MKQFFTILMLLFTCGAANSETNKIGPDVPPIPERNKICFGDKVELIVNDREKQHSVKLSIPTSYFGNYPVYQEDMQTKVPADHYKTIDDQWPRCAKAPIDVQFRNWPILIDEPIGDNSLDRRGTALESFPPNSLLGVSISISPSSYALQYGLVMRNKDQLRHWFNDQEKAGNLKNLVGGWRLFYLNSFLSHFF